MQPRTWASFQLSCSFTARTQCKRQDVGLRLGTSTRSCVDGGNNTMPGPTLATSDFRKYNAASCGHAEGWACHQQTTPARNSKRHASRAVTASVAEFRDRDSAAESPPDHTLRKTPSGRHLPLRERTHQRWNAHDTGQLLVDLAVPRLCCSQWSSWVADIADLQECNPADRA